jgi:radical SAM protein with 4Fe4S-binding SPASM domain
MIQEEEYFVKDRKQFLKSKAIDPESKLLEKQLSSGEKIKLNDSVTTKEFLDETLAINVDAASWVRTNETGSEILKLVNGNYSTEDIIKKISKIYAVPEKLISEDIISFIANCHKKGILVSNKGKSSLYEIGNMTMKKSVNSLDTVDNSLNTVYIDITEKCNLKCPYCYLDCSSNRATELKAEDWINTINEIDQLHVENLFITGGEPLLREDLFDILDSANFENIKTTGLLTNGTMVNSENIDDICDSFNVVQIALDGVNKETHEISRGKDTFDQVLKAIELLKLALDNSKLDQVLISMTVFEENKTEVSEMVRFAYSKNCNLSFFNVLPAGRANKSGGLHWLTSDEYSKVVIEAYKAFSEIVNENLKKGKKSSFYVKPSNVNYGSIYTTEPRHNCGLGIKELSIGSDGTVYPCRGLHFSDLSVGNIKDNELHVLYKKSVERFSNVTVNKNPACRSCNLKYFCGGGCRLYGYLSGELDGKDPNCKLHEASIYSAMLCKDKNIDEWIDATESMYNRIVN